MPKTSRETLKNAFTTGQTPTEENFGNIFDSFVHLDDKNSFIQKANQQEAEAGDNNEKYLTPLRAKQLVTALTRLSKLSDLSTDIQTKIDTAITNLVSGAPQALDNLRELADELQKNSSSISDILNKIKSKADKTHNHDSLYYKQSEVNNFFEGTNQGKKQVNWANITNLPTGFTPTDGSVTDSKITSSGISIDKVQNLRNTLDDKGTEKVFFSWREICQIDSKITTYPDSSRPKFMLIKIIPDVFSRYTLYGRQFLIRLQKQRGSSIMLRFNLEFVLSRKGNDPATIASWKSGGNSTTSTTQPYKAVSWRVTDVNPTPPADAVLRSDYVVELWHVQKRDRALSTELYLFVRWGQGGSFSSVDMIEIFPKRVSFYDGKAVSISKAMQVLPLSTEYRGVSVNPQNLSKNAVNQSVTNKINSHLRIMKFFFDTVRGKKNYILNGAIYDITHIKEEHPIANNPKHFAYRNATEFTVGSTKIT